MNDKIKAAQPKPNPEQTEILKNQFMRLAVLVNDNNTLIRILQELETCLVQEIAPNGERDYSRHAVTLQEVIVPYNNKKG